MHLRYEEDFVEEAVRLCVTGRRQGISSLQVARFNRHREKLYDVLDPDERNAAFFRLHLEWFREWGLETLLSGPLNYFALLPNALKVLAFRKSRGRNDEGAELYVNEGGERRGVVAMRPERLLREPELCGFLYHELTHLQDMVDPAFGYLLELPMSGTFISQQRVARERYRMLWDVTIDGRLTRKGWQTVATKDQRQQEFTRTFAFWSEVEQREVFETLWSAAAPTHQMLADLVCDPRHAQETAGPGPGAPCPLCGFPTFAWAATTSLAEPTINTIRSEFPHWTPEQGACARCAEIYRVNRSQSLSV
jgi:hypothetical protein